MAGFPAGAHVIAPVTDCEYFFRSIDPLPPARLVNHVISVYLICGLVSIYEASGLARPMALAHTLLVEGLHDGEFLARHCCGFDRIRPYLMGETDGQPKDAVLSENLKRTVS
jgi:hypothetical protein